MEKKKFFNFARDLIEAYSERCKPLCKEIQMPQTAFDILMFLGNNPAYKTASESVEIRGIKANLVSANVERLVQDGYLVRRPVRDDRRKVELLCTERARPIIAQGRRAQRQFSDRLFANMDDDTRAAFSKAMTIMEENLNEMLETGGK